MNCSPVFRNFKYTKPFSYKKANCDVSMIFYPFIDVIWHQVLETGNGCGMLFSSWRIGYIK